MSLESRMKIEDRGMFAASLFYVVVGVIFFALLPLNDYPPHVALIGILSLTTAYGLLRKRVWSVWFAAVLFFVATTFSAFMIYDSAVTGGYVFGLVTLAYLILTWGFTAYAAAKRRLLES